ncbi:S-layer homology domain-containing protein [Paenibacillus sp. YPG26]|uniref:S-layer homology domain-containing protein n=1 Tax=Paenibacillus sp. YPG26 TaxID=2878915 RepID=UPI0020406B20|nr:S-layer homology domain-containing protein [Paenibacillus sp. YPG26]USB34830.1 S-layer homology domain-containing protein [Paenibacillus sp. YPG26]
MSNKRSRKHQSRKAVSTMLVTAMCLSGGAAAFADTTTTAATTTTSVQSTGTASIFSDVANGYWAEKHIYKLASQGIILGDKGRFRPGDSITQEEAVTLALRFMNLDSKLPAAPVVPDQLKTGNYFKPYVALAIQHELIDQTEELATTGAKETWGTKKASREWIAKIIVRALGKEADAKAAASKATAFADNAKISAGARGFVTVAVDLGLTKGVDANRFDPRGVVTRAQIATFFSRAQAYLNPAYAGVYEGVISELTDSKLTLYMNGKTRSFVLDNRSVFFTSDSETKKAKSDLKPYTKVTVIDKAGSAAYVEVTDPKQQVDSAEGTFAKITGDNTIWLSTASGYTSYGYDAGTQFIDQNGKVITAAALTADSTIEIQRETYSPDKKTVMVKVKSGLVNKSGTGTIQAVDLNSKTLTVKDAAGGVEQYKVDDSTIVRYQSQIISLSELKPNSAVKYTVKNNVFTSLEVTQSVERTVRGMLVDVNGTSKLVTYKSSGGSLEAKFLADKPTILVDGIADAGLSDLIADPSAGDQVEITLDAQEKVTRIQVLGRQSELLNDLNVVSYDSKYKALTVINAQNKLEVYKLDDKTKLDYNTTQPTLSGAEYLLTKDRKISITHIGNRVLALQIVYKYEGTYVSANTSAKTVTIQLSGGKLLTLFYTGSIPPIEMYGIANPSVLDIKAGSSVVALLTPGQDAVQTLAVKTPVQFEVVSVDPYNNRIRVKSKGVTDEFYVDKAVLLGENGQSIKLADLTAGQFINVVFHGRTAVSVQAVKQELGKVLSSDGTSVTVKNYTGGTTSYSVASGVKVVRNGVVSTGSSTLTASDHVEVRKDESGQLVFTVLNSIVRPFNYYNASTKEVYVKHDFNDNNYRFVITLETYVHQGDTTLTVQSLKENDNIVLYFNNDKLVEIEKQ